MTLLAALQFLTRVPIRLRREPDLERTVAWFPVAGALIGLAVGGAGFGLWQVVPPEVAGALAVTIGLLVTGAFHEDGLGDVADAFGGGWTVERRLEILKDSRHGTYGVAAMCATIVVRIVALGAVPSAGTLLAAAIVAHTMGRVAAVVLAASAPLATHSGLGADYGRGTTVRRAVGGGTIGVAISALVAWWWSPSIAAVLTISLVVTVAVCVAATGALARRKIGGISGDVLGACEQVAECACMVVVGAFAAR